MRASKAPVLIRVSGGHRLSYRPNFFFSDPATADISTLSLHDALPIFLRTHVGRGGAGENANSQCRDYYKCEERSEEHTSELQSQFHLVCRLLLEKKKMILTS